MRRFCASTQGRSERAGRFDLPIAIGILLATGQLNCKRTGEFELAFLPL